MAKLKSGTRIYGTATIDTSVVVGSAVTLSSSGIQVSGISTLNSANTTQLQVTGVSTLGTVKISSGIVEATTGIITYYGDGSRLSGLGISISDNTTNSTYYVGYSTATSGLVNSLGISTSKLTFNPSTGTLSATVFTSLSDQSQKTNIRPIKDAIYLVSQMNGVYYDWKDDQNSSSVGVIAQEIEKVLPEVVTTNERGLKTVSYGNIVGVLIEAIKQQQIRIEELEKKLNA